MKLSGIHHIAVMAKDMKEHIAFFSEVMGCELLALFPMHGVPGGKHAFMKLNDHSYFSMVAMDAGQNIPIELGKTHAGSGAAPSAPGTMQHLAFRVDTDEDLLAMRDRIRSHGYNIIGPIDHGMCKSLYFAGPDGMALEIATPGYELVPERWVDPVVCEACGITPEEARHYMSPEPTSSKGGQVKQPVYDPKKYHQAYPEKVYMGMLAASDEQIAAAASYTEPPVPAE
ncbi:VOC family protein [Ponticaulis profundi]|uniref:VOC family protein n=1 Tax=Ponticaulis profundi TaxID=2665222 RepID=A0ABW1S6G2_9PROT